MTAEQSDWRRRSYLLALAGVTGGLAGCPSDDEPATSTAPTATTTATTTESTTTQTTAESTTTETETETPSVITFDGGGAAAFADALAALRSIPGGRLEIAPGTYRFDSSQAPSYDYPRSDDRVHFDGTGLTDVTIAGPPPEAEGSATIVLEDPTRGFLSFANPRGATATDRPRGATIRDLTVRHDPLPYTQGEIVELSDDRRTITLALDDGFPTVSEPPFTDPDPLLVSANVFTPEGARVGPVTEDARSNFKRFESMESLGGRQVRLRLAEGIEPGGLAVGRTLVVDPRHRDGTLFIHRDLTEPTYERVTIHSAPNFGFVFNACERPTLRDCTVVPATESAETSGLIATNADGIHCNNCPRGPLVEGCTLRRTNDDAVVADAELLVVDSFEDDRTVRVAADIGTRVGGGDRLTAVTPRLERIGTLPPVTEVDQRGGGVTSEPVNPEWIRFSESVRDRLEAGDALLGPRMHNRETVVRNTTVESVRARYVRFGGVNGGVVESNRFAGTNSDGVEVEAAGEVRDGFSDRKGWSEDIEIRNNEILDTGLVGVPSGIPRAIVVGIDGGEGPPPNPSETGRLHRNVQIAGNTIRRVGGHAIEVADTEGVELTGNQIERVGLLPGPAFSRYGLGVANSSEISIQNTTVETDTDETLGFGWTHESEGVAASGNTFLVGGDQRSVVLTGLGEQ